jgi:hypothetical protein
MQLCSATAHAYIPRRRQPHHHNHRPPATTYLIRDNSVLMKDLRLGE